MREPDDVEAALEAAYAEPEPAPKAVRPTEAARRRAAEQRAVTPLDGRRARYIGRSVQLNIKVKPELKDRVMAASRDHGMPVTALAEQAFEQFIASLERKRGA